MTSSMTKEKTWRLKEKVITLALNDAKAKYKVLHSFHKEREETAKVIVREANARLLEAKADVLREKAMMMRENATMAEKRTHKQRATAKILAAKTYLENTRRHTIKSCGETTRSCNKYNMAIRNIEHCLDKLKRQERGEKSHAKKQKEVALQRAQEEKAKATTPIQYLTGTRLDTLPTWDIIHENIMPYLDIDSRFSLNAVLPPVERGGWKRLSKSILSEDQQKQIMTRKPTIRWIETYAFYGEYDVP